MAKERKGRIVLIVLLVILLAVALIMILPVIKVLAAAITAAYIFLPMQTFLENKLKRPWLASLTVLLVILLFIVVPLILSGLLLTSELSAVPKDIGGTITKVSDSLSKLKAPPALASVISQDQIQQYTTRSLRDLTGNITHSLQTFLFNVVNALVLIAIFLFLTYFFLRDHKKISSGLYNIIDNLFTKDDAKKLKGFTVNVGKTMNSVIRGTLIVAFVQSLLLVPMYFLVGLGTPILWGIVTFFAALLPLLGVPIVWVPILVIRLGQGIATHDSGLIVRSIIFGLWAIFIVSTIDNIIKPAVISRGSNIHPVVIILGIIGGLAVFGFAGVIIGPVILTFIILFLDAFLLDKNLSVLT